METGKKILVTGSNSGIGYSIVDQLLAGTVYSKIFMTSRNSERGQKAIN